MIWLMEDDISPTNVLVPTDVFMIPPVQYALKFWQASQTLRLGEMHTDCFDLRIIIQSIGA